MGKFSVFSDYIVDEKIYGIIIYFYKTILLITTQLIQFIINVLYWFIFQYSNESVRYNNSNCLVELNSSIMFYRNSDVEGGTVTFYLGFFSIAIDSKILYFTRSLF